ncbi:MAG: blue (type 1) copper domain protein, partial [Frankiales bacterium]|nr:blue (type 1) copper domain protein [Frankiales bacterium]
AACGGGDAAQDAPAAGGGSGGEVTAEGPPDAQTAALVGNTRLRFVPSTVRAKPGSLALTLTIEGGVPHNLVFRDQALGADIDTFSEGSRTGTFRFPAAGTFDFTCTLHPGMDGTVVVA